jgi:hypothetical protein
MPISETSTSRSTNKGLVKCKRCKRVRPIHVCGDPDCLSENMCQPCARLSADVSYNLLVWLLDGVPPQVRFDLEGQA